jgi:hypothetical protein
MPGDWALPDQRRLFLGARNHLKFRNIRIGPPAPRPEPPAGAPATAGRPIDLLALVDPDRDAVAGRWERRGASLRVLGNSQRSKLVVPYDPPSDYKLTMHVVREPGGESNDQPFLLNLPTARSKAMVGLDGGRKTISGVAVDEPRYDRPVATFRGAVIQEGTPQEIVCFVRGTGIKVQLKDRTIIDWTGNPGRFCAIPAIQTPGRQIGLVSVNSRFRIDKLEIEPLPAEQFAPANSKAEGPLLPSVNLQRDTRKGDWILQDNALTCSAGYGTRFNLPVQVPPRYKLSATIERLQGDNHLYLGLVVGGHSTSVTLDGEHSAHAGLDMLDGRRFLDSSNATHRKYDKPLLPPNRAIRVECLVTEDALLVACDEAPVLRWQGDPRRLDSPPDFRPLNEESADRNGLWLGAWESSFRFRNVELRPLSDADSLRLSKPSEL